MDIPSLFHPYVKQGVQDGVGGVGVGSGDAKMLVQLASLDRNTLLNQSPLLCREKEPVGLDQESLVPLDTFDLCLT